MRRKSMVTVIALFLMSAPIFMARTPGDAKPRAKKAPYRSTEELREKYSGQLLARAAQEMKRIEDSNARGRYKPTWESVDSHPLPEWFDDAKFGMFIDWGVYSVGGWDEPKATGPMYPDWYLHHMYYNDVVRDYHARRWGLGFERDDLIPLFTASEYDPEKLVKIAQDAGMKYIIPFCKHHDGFCLWPSSYTFRDAGDMGPGRDLVGPLVAECRKADVKFGVYFSIDEWEYPILGQDNQLQIRLWDTPKGGTLTTRPFNADEWRGRISGKVPVRNFHEDYIIPQAAEFIDRYDPDILWFDGEWIVPEETRHTRKLIAYYYNRADGRKPVVVNDRIADKTRAHYGDVFTSEYHSIQEQGKAHKWEENRGISQSFGYNRDDTDKNVITSEQLVRMLVETVSHNGNLLLIVNLDGKGAMPEIYVERLKAAGDWLKVNGEAIYATRPWTVAAEGSVRFTRRGKTVYAIYLGAPSGEVNLKSVHAATGSKITMLGREKALEWRETNDGISIKVPADGLGPYASTFKIQTP
jgi:alpha-L-fucosidase